MTITCTTLTDAAVVFRLASRFALQRTFGLDDILIIVAAVSFP